MAPALLLSLREGLEIALIIGIILGALRKTKRGDLKSAVWAGAGTAAVFSLLIAYLLGLYGKTLEGHAEQIFEGITMLLAVGLLTWMIFWMVRQSRTIKGEIETNVRRATIQAGKQGLFFLAFIAVVREGIELALFFTAASFTVAAIQAVIGATLGLVIAALLGWAFFTSTIRLDLRKFFLVTGALLIFFAAGLAAHGVHELNEAGWIPTIVEHVWNTSSVLNEDSTVGSLVGALFGYNSNPSLSELLAYIGYFVVIISVVYLNSNALPTSQEVPS